MEETERPRLPFALSRKSLSELWGEAQTRLHGAQRGGGGPGDRTSGTRLSERVFGHLVESAFWASYEQEEGRNVRFHISICAPDSASDTSLFGQEDDVLQFTAQYPLSIDTIRRLAPALSARHVRLAAYYDTDNALTVWGATTFDSPELEVVCMERGRLFIRVAGQTLAVLTSRSISFIDATLLQPESPFFQVLKPRLLNAQGVIAERRLPVNMLHAITMSMYNHGHGGSILVVPNEDRVTKSLKQDSYFRVKHGYSDEIAGFETHFANDLDRPVDPAFQEKHKRILESDVIGELARAWSLTLFRDSESAHQIGSLSAIDGALLLDEQLHVVGFGAKISPVSAGHSPRTVLVRRPVRGDAPTLCSMADLGGTRHQSAAQFVFDQRDCLAIVASQDGALSMFAWEDAQEQVIVLRDCQVVWLPENSFKEVLLP